MNEKDIFDEKQEIKKATFSCPHCGEQADHDVRWLKRTKKKKSARNMNERDRARFENSKDYMIRVDDVLSCKNGRCRRRFDIPTSQTVVFI